MSRLLPVLGSILLLGTSAQANGLLIPTEKQVPPLGLVSQEVAISIEDQAAITRVEQVFRNHTERALEATYVFPVPKGASVREFAMWVNGAKMSGQLMEAAEARTLYTEIVQRTQDPGLLEYLDANLFRLKVFPVPANGEQKIALSYTSVAESDHGTIEYRYPLKTDAKALASLDKFNLDVKLKSQHRLQSIYSPSHAVTITRAGDHEARVAFAANQTRLDKDFQLYYTTGDKDVGLTALVHRPYATRDGHFMLVISPRAELSKDQQAPRDMVFVLDTSGSMSGKRITQARNALKYCLTNLHESDRFAVLHFSNTVNRYTDNLEKATSDNIAHAAKWVERLEATGGTSIQAALTSALEMRPTEKDRTFTVVFFTDGKPTVGETDAQRIQDSVLKNNTANTRIFTFGVGDDVNATLLDALAERSRAVSTYVRENDDIEERVSSFYSKINHPVFTNLRLSAAPEIRLAEVYPAELPDLFHGTQLVVLGKYTGDGAAALKLAGTLGTHAREFTYQVNFPKQAKEEKTFVEDLWARRKVGHLLDQIRRNGELAELKDEVIRLAKRHGITTPYTSYLVAPDEAQNVGSERKKATQPDRPDVRFQVDPSKNGGPSAPPQSSASLPTGGLRSMSGTGGGWINSRFGIPPAQPLLEVFGRPSAHGWNTSMGGYGCAGFGGGVGGYPYVVPSGSGMMGMGGYTPGSGGPSHNFGFQPNNLPSPTSGPVPLPKVNRVQFAPVYVSPNMQWASPNSQTATDDAKSGAKGQSKSPEKDQTASAGKDLENVRRVLASGRLTDLDSGKAAIDLAEHLKSLRTGNQVEHTVTRTVAERTLLQIDGVWIDEGFTEKLPSVRVKALSKAYFRILERQPQMREVFALGNRLIWVTPSGSALIIELQEGLEEISDEEIARLFAASK